MAYYRKKRTSRKRAYTRRRKYAKRKVSRKRATAMVSRGLPVSDRCFAKLRYTTRLDLTPVTAPTDSWVFSGNSLFDPDVSGSGSQPMGFDQYATFYNKYRCRGSKIVVRAAATSGSHFPCKLVVYPQDDNATVTGVDNAAARAFARTGVTSGYGGPVTTLKNYMTSKKQFGVKSINEETSYAAAVNANPSLRWYWCISVGTLDLTTSIAGMYAEIEITYYTEFYDTVDLVLS